MEHREEKCENESKEPNLLIEKLLDDLSTPSSPTPETNVAVCGDEFDDSGFSVLTNTESLFKN